VRRELTPVWEYLTLLWRRLQVVQRRLLRALPQHVRLLTVASIGFSVAAVVVAAIGGGHSAAANVTAVVLVLIGAGLSVLGSRLTRSRVLGPGQRRTLVQMLGRVPALEVRVSSVDERESIRYARELRNVMTEARWPVTGVFRHQSAGNGRGVVLAVRNVVAPPSEAITLMNTLRRVGVPATWEHRPELAGDRVIEVLVGRIG
jgi:hypothetical protein